MEVADINRVRVAVQYILFIFTVLRNTKYFVSFTKLPYLSNFIKKSVVVQFDFVF